MRGPGIHLSAGELITCENNHPFGRVMYDCDAGKGNWTAAIDWLQYTPTDSSPTHCRACDGRWILILSVLDDPSNRRARIHVGDQWRPPLDERDRKHLAGQQFVTT